MASDSSRTVDRRTVLRAMAAGTLLAGTAGCSRAESFLGDAAQALGLADTVQTDRSFYSGAMRGEKINWRVLTPTDFDGPARAVLYLTGPDAGYDNGVRRADADGPLLDSRDSGRPALAMVTVDGGRGYFHPRADGTDAGEMIIEELLPRMRDEAGLDVSVLGLAGFAGGGYGALRLAADWNPARSITGTTIGAVAVADPHVWRTFGDVPQGAFDSAKQFERFSLFDQERLNRLREVPAWIAIAENSPYSASSAHLRSTLQCAGGVWPGEHDETFQRDVIDAQVAFIHSRLDE